MRETGAARVEMAAAPEFRAVDTSVKAVDTSVNSPFVPSKQDLPPIEESDPDIELQEDIKEPVKGWRLEQNSNGYWRWRFQTKSHNGAAVTYKDKSGKIAYKKGSQYVKLGKLDDARKKEAQLRADEPI